MTATQLVLLAVVLLIWWAIHLGLLKWMVLALFLKNFLK